MQHIPHSTFDDEARFIVIISGLIKKGQLPSLKTWETSVKDEKSKLVRKKQSDKEAEEAEELAKELGVWDEFYGSGKPSSKKGKGKGKGKGKASEEEEGDVSALQALILKRKKDRDGFFDNLAAKYAEPEPTNKAKGRKGKKRAAEEEEEEVSPPKKRTKKDPPETTEMDDEEFEALQKKLFGDKAKRTQSGSSTPAKGKKGARTRKGR